MPLIKPSMRAFFEEARNTPGFSWFQRLHGWFYLAFPYFYIGNGVGERQPARFILRTLGRLLPSRRASRPASKEAITFADTYHGKVVPLETARRLVSVRENIAAALPEQVLPYKLARDLVLHDPDHLVALDCPCRVARANPCLPLDVCLIVGEPFASLVLEHHPRRSRRITAGEAVDILEAEEVRGHVHHAFFKDAMLGRFYAVCNCCSCCCGAMQAQRGGTPMLASSGFISQVDDALCAGCGVCVDICPFDAMTMPQSAPQIDEARCMGCGLCISHCAVGALQLTAASQKGLPLEVPVS